MLLLLRVRHSMDPSDTFSSHQRGQFYCSLCSLSFSSPITHSCMTLLKQHATEVSSRDFLEGFLAVE